MRNQKKGVWFYVRWLIPVFLLILWGKIIFPNARMIKTMTKGLSWSLAVDKEKVASSAQLKSLNQMKPSFYALGVSSFTGSKIEDVYLNQYIRYFRKVIEYYPSLSGAYSVLGFCLYQKDQPEEAAQSFQKAIALNPYILWNYYNLGLMYFQASQYEAALKIFDQAIALKMDGTLKSMYASRIYQQIFANVKETGQIPGRLKQGVAEIFYFRGICLQQLGDQENTFDSMSKARQLYNNQLPVVSKPHLKIF